MPPKIASEIYYYGETDKQLLFRKNVMSEEGGPIAARNNVNYTIEGNGGSFTTGLSGYIYTGYIRYIKERRWWLLYRRCNLSIWRYNKQMYCAKKVFEGSK